MKPTQIFQFIRLLSVEPICFLSLFMMMIKKSALDQLIQDKICLQRYELPQSYCFNLPSLNDTEDIYGKKSTILADVTSFNMYLSIGVTVPTLLIVLFIGPIIDRLPLAKRYLLIYASIVMVIESLCYLANSYYFSLSYYYVILGQVANALSAGPQIAITCSVTYLSAVTPARIRSFKLVILEVACSTAIPAGIALSGNLLELTPLFPEHELRNYCLIFLISSLLSVVMFAVCFLAVNEQKDRRLFEQHFGDEVKVVDEKVVDEKVEDQRLGGSSSGSPTYIGPDQQVKSDKIEKRTPKVDEKASVLRVVFDFGNIREQIRTLTRKREHSHRMQIILLFLSKLVFQLAFLGPSVFMYQYVQKVFGWGVGQYSNYYTATQFINILSTFAATPFVFKLCKVSDLNCVLLGSFLVFAQNVIRASSTAVWAFYAALPFHLLNSLANVGVQAHLTKIVVPNELGRVFSLMGVMDASIPLLASLIYSNVFRLTIDTWPNLSFATVAGGIGIGFLINVCVAFISKRQSKTATQKDMSTQENDEEKF